MTHEARPSAVEEMAEELEGLELPLGEGSPDGAPRTTEQSRTSLPRRFGRRSESWDERSGRLHAELQVPCRAMIRRAFRTAFSDDEIDDLYSNAWLGTLRALRTRHARMEEEEVRRYVMAAVANHAVKELRRRKRKPIAPLEAAGPAADPSASPAELATSSERSRMTRDLLASLPPRRRAVMLLRYGWGLEPGQVCGLVEGLSPRAYRKEITRGVEEFTARLRKLDDGEWCEEREPILQAFVAGTADADQQLQAKAHLAHCRGCNDFVARLGGHLHDVGSAIAMPGALDALDGRISLPDKVIDLADRARESAAGVFGRGQAAAEPITTSAASGGTRGAGGAGAGIAAKLAGLGGVGKVASACVAGGAAAVCVATGVAPLPFAANGERPAPEPAAKVVEDEERPGRVARPEAPDLLPSQVGNETPANLDAPAQPIQNEKPETAAPEPEPVAEEQAAPPVVQEFSPVAPATPAPAPSGGSSSSSSSGSSQAATNNSEFGL